MTAKKLKTLGVDEETHILLKKIQTIIYENKGINFDLKKIIYLLVIDPKKSEELIVRNLKF